MNMTMILMLTITHIVSEYKFECIDLVLVSFYIVIDLFESIIIPQQLHIMNIFIIIIC